MASSTWQLQHTPAAGGDATTYTLAQLHASLVIEFVNWGMDTASLQCGGASPAFDAAAFAYRDQIVVLRDGVRFFVGVVTGLGLSAEAEPQSRTYTLSGPSWWLANLPFRWPFWPVKADLDAGERIASSWLQFAVDSAKGAGAPVEYSGYSAFSIPTPDLRASSTCLEVVQRVARLFPMSAGWWDYTTTPPTFRASLRAGLTQQTVTIGAGISTFGFTPLPDRQLTSVRIGYTYDPGDGTTATEYDDAGTAPETVGPNRLHVSVECASSAEATEAANLHIADILHASLSPLAWSGTVNLSAEQCTALPEIRPGNSLSVLGGRTEWETMWTSVQTVQWSVSAAAPDLCTINLGAPEHLGPQDYLEFARSGALGGSGGAGNLSPYDPPGPPPPPPGDDDLQPGTIDDLNGTPPAVAPDGTITIQSLGGTWSLVGYPTFDGSSPTVRYRTRTNSGAHEWVGTPSFPYDSTTCTHRYAYTGSNTYDAVTGLCSGDRLRTWSLSGDGAGTASPCLTSIVSPGDTTCGCETAVDCGILGDVADTTITPTVWTRGAGTSDPDWTGEAVVTLSAQDTEDDAWQRLIMATDWTDSVSTAIRTVSATIASGQRRRLRWGTYAMAGTPAVMTYTPITGLAVWQRYRCRATEQRRPVDESGTATGAWADAGAVYSPYFVAGLDGSGGWEWADVIEPTAGYESQLTDITLEEG